MVRYVVEQRGFLYESYKKRRSVRKCWRKCKFPGITFWNPTYDFFNARSNESLTDKKPAKRRRVLTKEGATLEHTPVTETPCTRDRHPEIAVTLTDEPELRPYKAAVLHALQPRDPATRINFCNWFLHSVHDDEFEVGRSLQNKPSRLRRVKRNTRKEILRVTQTELQPI
jgi:hypothetical protein